MKKLFYTTCALCLFASPVCAQPNQHANQHAYQNANHSQDHTCQGGHNCNTGTGSTSSNNSVNVANDLMVQYNPSVYSSNTSNSSSSSSSSSSNTNVVANSASGGSSQSDATGGSANSTATGGQGGTGGNSSTNVEVKTQAAAASAFAPALTSSDDTCMGSSSVGGQAVGFGITAGTTWRDEDCVRRKNARFLHNMGNTDAAIALMCQDDDVFAAIIATGTEELKLKCLAVRHLTTATSKTAKKSRKSRFNQ